MNKARRTVARDPRTIGIRPGLAGVFLLMMGVLSTGAQETNFAPAELSFDALMVHASRYGTTETKRVRKRLAHDELMHRKAAALDYLVNHTYIENMWFFIYGHELNRTLEDEAAVPVLLAALGSSHSNVVRTATYFLGFHQAPDQANALLPLLDDDFTAGTAIRTLGKWKCDQAVPRIIPFLKNKKERRRIVAANALRDIHDPQAVPSLIDALDDPFFTVRNAAARALVMMGDSAQPALREALATSSGMPRRQLIRILSDTRAKAAIPLLKPLLKCGDLSVQNDARTALRRIRDAQGPKFFIH